MADKLIVSGARGESFADVARRVGEIGNIAVHDTATDANVLDLMAQASIDAVQPSVDAAQGYAQDAEAHADAAGTYYAGVLAEVGDLDVDAILPLQAVDRTVLAAFTGMTSGRQAWLGEPGRQGVFKWSVANHAADVTADLWQGIYVAPAAAPTGASGAWVRQLGNNPVSPEMFGAVSNGVGDDAPGILSALNHPMTTKVQLRTATYMTGANILVPANKSIAGEGVGATIVKRLPYPISGPGPGAAVFRWADEAHNVSISDLTIDGNRAGQGGTSAYRCHGIEMRGLNFNIERVDIENCTGYATVAYGSASPCSGTIRHVRAWNSNVCFEQIGDTTGGITIIDCRAYSAPRDGGAAVSFGCESFLHQYSAASNITVIRFYAEGETTLAGFLPVIAGVPGDVKDITLIDCQFHMTGEGAPIAAIGVDGYKIKRLRLIGSTFSSPNRASGPAIQFTDCEDVEAIGCRFEGRYGGVYLTAGSTAEFTACNVLAVNDDPAGGPYGIYSDAPAGAVRFNGGSITAIGSVPVAYVGPVVVSSATPTTPTQSSSLPEPRSGTGDSGGGIGAGAGWLVSVEGFDATGYALSFRVWGVAEGGAYTDEVSVGAVTKTVSGFSTTVTNETAVGQVLHVEWIAVPL
jgi:hypothetical protein